MRPSLINPFAATALAVACVGPSSSPVVQVTTDRSVYEIGPDDAVPTANVTIQNNGAAGLSFGGCPALAAVYLDRLDGDVWRVVDTRNMFCLAILTTVRRDLAPGASFSFRLNLDLSPGRYRIRVPDNTFTNQPPANVGHSFPIDIVLGDQEIASAIRFTGRARHR